MKTLHIGFNSYIVASRLVAVMDPGSEPAKRLRHEAKTRDMLVDIKKGRRTNSMIITDSNHVFLSNNSPEIIKERIEGIDES